MQHFNGCSGPRTFTATSLAKSLNLKKKNQLHWTLANFLAVVALGRIVRQFLFSNGSCSSI